MFGRTNADNCPVNDLEIEEENKIYFVGNCKYGNGKYGSHNNFVDGNLSNENFLEILGEKYDSNSFCVLSSVLPEDKKNIFTSYSEDTTRALCYPMFCSSKSLSIQVFDECFAILPPQSKTLFLQYHLNAGFFPSKFV